MTLRRGQAVSEGAGVNALFKRRRGRDGGRGDTRGHYVQNARVEISGTGFQHNGRGIPVDLVGWPTRTRESNTCLQELILLIHVFITQKFSRHTNK